MENKVLGKGLSALISQNKDVRENEAISKQESISSLEIDLIKNNPLQPRQNYDKAKLDELKASIKDRGLLQPIVVRPAGEGYEVIAGERRLRAARDLGLKKVPVLIKNATDREVLVIALIENMQRQDLNAIEEAEGIKRLMEEFHFSQEAAAESLGKDRTTVVNLLRLLKLPKDIQTYVIEGKISSGHARSLITIENAQTQKRIAEEVVSKGLSVRQVEAMVRDLKVEAVPGQKAKSAVLKDRDMEILEEELSKHLGTKVLVENKNNKGKVIIEYYSLTDFDRILKVIKK